MSRKLSKKAEAAQQAALETEAQRRIDEMWTPLKEAAMSIAYTEDLIDSLAAEVYSLEREKKHLYDQCVACWQQGLTSSPLLEKMGSIYSGNRVLSCRDFNYTSPRAISLGMQKLKLLMSITFARYEIAELTGQ
jgi:hypothetical protein